MRPIFKKSNFSHVFIFLSGIILFCAILIYIVPSGEFQRETKKTGNLELAGIPYKKWARFILPLFLVTTLNGFIAMAFAVATSY
jgi:uncharacterized ion transporter superfamily protein YfcC